MFGLCACESERYTRSVLPACAMIRPIFKPFNGRGENKMDGSERNETQQYNAGAEIHTQHLVRCFSRSNMNACIHIGTKIYWSPIQRCERSLKTKETKTSKKQKRLSFGVGIICCCCRCCVFYFRVIQLHTDEISVIFCSLAYADFNESLSSNICLMFSHIQHSMDKKKNISVVCAW